MKILITGSTGFIGRNLVEKLSSEYEILHPPHKELELLNIDDLFDFFENTKVDIVIHCANFDPKIESDRAKIVEYNLRMFFNLISFRSKYKKLIYFGSGAEFDREKNISEVSEEDFGKRIPQDPYGFSKYVMNTYVRAINNNIYNLRLFGIFGKYENWKRRFISNMCVRALLNLPLIIKQNAVFDYIYINDLVKIVKWFIEKEPKYKDYNIVSGRKIELIDLAKIILKVTNKNLPIIVKKSGFQPEYTAKNVRLLSEIKDFKFSNYEDSIKELCNWYKTQIKDIAMEILEV